VVVDAAALADLPPEIRLRLLGRAINWSGNEGPVELGKLEALEAALSEPLSAVVDDLSEFARFRRTLAGALVTLKGKQLLIERAPARRAARIASKQGALTKRARRRSRFTKPR
jgi:tRNA(Ile)-lysidine synthase